MKKDLIEKVKINDTEELNENLVWGIEEMLEVGNEIINFTIILNIDELRNLVDELEKYQINELTIVKIESGNELLFFTILLSEGYKFLGTKLTKIKYTEKLFFLYCSFFFLIICAKSSNI